ncbi:MAG TPA: histidine kinase [Actinomycetota bacterium]|nr:histidine kinase [Actinomycetota bacterium]
MRESGWSPLRRAVRWWPAVGDLGLAVVVLVLTADQGTGTTDAELLGEAPAAMRMAFGIGLAMLVLIRRANPYPLLALGTAAWAVMGAPWGLMVAGYTIAARPRRPRGFGVLLGVLALVVLARMLVVSEVSALFAVVVTVLVVGVPVLLGLWIGIRRALIAHLRDEAERLEREQLLDAERAKAQERARIAREMHDVVAHRVGLMVLHAGALEVSLADPAAAQQAALVRQTGREALQELRDILGILREGEDRALLDPQPTLADLDRLVQQSRDTGMAVSVAVDGTRRQLPATVERTAYRLVQEALTNVHRHAANAATEVGVRYGRQELEVAVRNARPANGPHPGLALASGGHGLVGLRERVTLLGGTFQAGPRLDGGFEVRASIPCQVPA